MAHLNFIEPESINLEEWEHLLGEDFEKWRTPSLHKVLRALEVCASDNCNLYSSAGNRVVIALIEINDPLFGKEKETHVLMKRWEK